MVKYKAIVFNGDPKFKCNSCDLKGDTSCSILKCKRIDNNGEITELIYKRDDGKNVSTMVL